MITDDNLTAHRKRVKVLLAAIRDWNAQQKEEVTFSSQISIDAAGDEELLQLLADAGVTQAFIGIETPNEDSLRETKKFQNVKGDLVAQVERFIENGIMVMGGMIVGFDADGPDIFSRQFEFAMSLPVPVFTPAPLFAPETTPLYARLQQEGRVIGGSADHEVTPWSTNIIPLQMTNDQLQSGLKWLCNRLYSPDAFGKRILRLAKVMSRRRAQRRAARRGGNGSLRRVERDCLGLLRKLPFRGLREAMLAAKLTGLALRRPAMIRSLLFLMLFYMQVRHLFDRGQYWDPALAKLEEPEPHGEDRVSRAVADRVAA
jgi:hypothetical protein